jgi:hypothetical protein
MLFETKNGRISILYGLPSHDPLDKHTLPSTMLNLFRWALTPQCPEIIFKKVVKFSLRLPFLKHGIRKTLGKKECENLPVSLNSQLFFPSSNILCFTIEISILDCTTYCPKYPVSPQMMSSAA